jgi:hypothetical protein
MRKIVEYFIVEDENLGNLETYVNDKIKEGFEPFGNMTVIHQTHDGFTTYHFYQTTVRYEG